MIGFLTLFAGSGFQFVLALKCTHPGAGAFGGSGKIVAQKSGNPFAGFVLDRENANIRMIGCDALLLRDRDAEKPVCHIKTGSDDVIQLK